MPLRREEMRMTSAVTSPATPDRRPGDDQQLCPSTISAETGAFDCRTSGFLPRLVARMSFYLAPCCCVK